MKALILFLALQSHTDAKLERLRGELSYWDNQYYSMQDITPYGRYERKINKETLDFYHKRRAELLNEINSYEQGRTSNTQRLQS